DRLRRRRLPSDSDVSSVGNVDPADVTNKIYKYTDLQFHQFQFLSCEKQGKSLWAVLVAGVSVPIVFSKAGTYAVDNSKQKTAFSAGTVYFRHGAKSEPGNSNDLRRFMERQIEMVRRSWLDGIAKVVEAPSGARIVVLPPVPDHQSSAAVA